MNGNVGRMMNWGGMGVQSDGGLNEEHTGSWVVLARVSIAVRKRNDQKAA